MGKPIAVMDLGTNTFHLLIAEGDPSNPTILFQTTNPVKLGEGGINKGLIAPAAYERGVKAIKEFSEEIAKHDADEVKAIATSALRSANNGQAFIDEVKATTGIQIETINGDEEAGYIYNGVKAGGCLSQQNSLIIDIGGGSVEFILGNENEILWKQSFEIGAARLMDKFHQIDPITPEAINGLNTYLEERLADMLTTISGYQVSDLIGSSGAFETFAEVIEAEKGNPFNIRNIKHYTFDTDELIGITDKLISSSHEERKNTKSIIPVRVDMIVVASLVTRFVMEKLGIYRVALSTNSLKEGVASALLAG
ncbi:MAG: exopolyphosphatase [Sphingobacteriaceae bacterium]|nr:MAG: exopolyphosphatase [Sphingobacteriaceae bacterium]